MPDTYEEVVSEVRQHLAHVQGELAAVRDQLAASAAAELQLREEIEAYKTEAAVARAELAQLQKRADERVGVTDQRIGDLEEQLRQSRLLQAQAERERASVIAALGRRARRQLDQAADE